jgi:nitronate monooxygenase
MSGWSELARRLGVAHPLVLAPLGGGPGTPALAAAVCGAGGLGSLGAAYLQPEQVRDAIRQTRRLTDRPFAVNLFAGGPTDGAADPEPMLRLLAHWHQSLGIAPPPRDPPPLPDFHAQLEVVLDEEVPAFSWTFGIPDAPVLDALRRRGVFLMGTATTVREAVALQDAHVDAVVAQGSEAGGHRGTFLGPLEEGMVGTMALVPQVVDAVRVPVLASGGIMDGRGIAAARMLGASGAVMGTAFLMADEAGTSAPYRARLASAHEDATAITRAYSGRPARGIRTAFMDQVRDQAVPIPPFPLQNTLTRAVRAAAAERGNADVLSLWAGQGLRMLRTGPAADLTRAFLEEAEALWRHGAAE